MPYESFNPAWFEARRRQLLAGGTPAPCRTWRRSSSRSRPASAASRPWACRPAWLLPWGRGWGCRRRPVAHHRRGPGCRCRPSRWGPRRRGRRGWRRAGRQGPGWMAQGRPRCPLHAPGRGSPDGTGHRQLRRAAGPARAPRLVPRPAAAQAPPAAAAPERGRGAGRAHGPAARPARAGPRARGRAGAAAGGRRLGLRPDGRLRRCRGSTREMPRDTSFGHSAGLMDWLSARLGWR
jgi:hypothetical protein